MRRLLPIALTLLWLPGAAAQNSTPECSASTAVTGTETYRICVLWRTRRDSPEYGWEKEAWLVEVPIPGRLTQYRSFLSTEIGAMTRAEAQRTAYAKVLYFVNCRSRSILPAQTIYYTTRGSVVKSVEDSYRTGSRAVPGTVGEGALDAICGGSMSYDSSVPPPPPPPPPPLPPPPPRNDGPPPDFVAVEKQPVPVDRVEPEYPEIARQAGIEGRVTVRVWVGRDGRVKDVQVLRSDNEIFNENALAAVRRWRFEPAIQAGYPVDVWVTIPIRFRQNRRLPPDVVVVDTRPIDTPPVPIDWYEPMYPEEARRTGAEGSVTLRARVARDGRVLDAQLIRSDNALFNGNALAAASTWRFQPAMKDGVAVDVWVTLTLYFRQTR